MQASIGSKHRFTDSLTRKLLYEITDVAVMQGVLTPLQCLAVDRMISAWAESSEDLGIFVLLLTDSAEPGSEIKAGAILSPRSALYILHFENPISVTTGETWVEYPYSAMDKDSPPRKEGKGIRREAAAESCEPHNEDLSPFITSLARTFLSNLRLCIACCTLSQPL